ncbi:tRNA threonylcarbamoyl adenosine modification protein YeaZ [Salinibacterium amurskyense]|uniref:tRNA threonylcarbamoyl adenosine modification protein YeaZ n=1 Tax=Salinibacterium amurskyense TaxID=205941 RepID=A0A2M9D7D8_9MICO|nr:tRNA (adenosine(37)-N6)-threonylcarbamoyltransferase complex dimerization subunit type 1 TsaB [Salinibacterium amurskyense]PJJ81570.1 tRNA threonylcarbamoyl adenosine modification protein YeaZ [Salinibacterium amurskyense]RLQ83555.1 tRNA (adenosine(37)-N6)-threonylcarbamoyltransferase complex dimerization subunit type 1 TsaB [Salinibacterium amurskyense]GHD80066.1 tRNA (adenosine(37)-N6)-threonylcarbamoyltransferase complex dimerization subunit type 1 TsaB [Salinibacterium amurskyense]
MLLAIDTSAGTTVAVVAADGSVRAERNSLDTRKHAEVVGDFIHGALADAGVAVTDLTGVVAGMGPGPFTGLRVGIVAARAFAFGAGLPLLPVVTHDALALGETEPVVVATDARRKELYWSTYEGSDAAGLPILVEGPALAPAAELATSVPNFEHFALRDTEPVQATRLARLAHLLRENDRPFAGEEALYLRSPDVTPSAGPKRVTA